MDCMLPPEISVIISVYNTENNIERCINSLIVQSFNNFETILVNDGSTDNSKEICEKFVLKNNRIRLINKSNGGAGSARNAGIDVAIGKYIYFLDSDDEIESDLLEKVYTAMSSCDASLVVFAIERDVVDSNTGRILSVSYSKSINKIYETREKFQNDFSNLYYNDILFGGPVNKLFDGDVIRNHKIRFPNIKRGQDELFNLYYYRYVEKLVVIPDVLYKYYAYDEASKNKKYRLGYFKETQIRYLKEIESLLSDFKLYDDYTTIKFQHSFVYSLDRAFQLAWNPVEKLRIKDKIKFIDSVLNEEYVKVTIASIIYLPKECKMLWQAVKKNNTFYIYIYYGIQNWKSNIKKLLLKGTS